MSKHREVFGDAPDMNFKHISNVAEALTDYQVVVLKQLKSLREELITLIGGGGGQNLYLYKSEEIDFYGGGYAQTHCLFKTETGKGRFIPTRVTLEMTDITGAPDFANIAFDTMPNVFAQTSTTLTTTCMSNYAYNNYPVDTIPENTITNISITQNTLLAIVKGIFRIEGYYENDYVLGDCPPFVPCTCDVTLSFVPFALSFNGFIEATMLVSNECEVASYQLQRSNDGGLIYSPVGSSVPYSSVNGGSYTFSENTAPQPPDPGTLYRIQIVFNNCETSYTNVVSYP